MATRGPKPQPANLKILRGNPGGRKIKDTVKPAPKRPRCPTWLIENKTAHHIWLKISKELDSSGLLVGLDSYLLALFCRAYATIIDCELYIEKQGGIAVYLEGKNSQTAPHLAALKDARAFVKGCIADFGLSPSARSRLEIIEKEAKHEYLDW